MKKIFVVRLPEDERLQLQGLLKAGKAAALKLTRARILLKADQQPGAPACTDAEIADALEVSPKTVFNVRRKWVELGLEQALEGKNRTRLRGNASSMATPKQSSWQPVAVRHQKEEPPGHFDCLLTKLSNWGWLRRSVQKPFDRR